MRTSLSKILVLAAALALVPQAVKADLPGTVAPSCVIASGYPGMDPFDYCWGAYPGNDPSYTADIIALLSGYAGGSWSFLETVNAASSGTYFNTVPGVVTGTLNFSSPLIGPFALVLKAADQFSIYYYANGGPGVSSVNFNTYGVNVLNPGSQVNALSHASLYSAGSVVPEPSTVFLLATGLLGLGFVEVRRRRKA